MTKKKFVKQMMALGYSRNEANAAAISRSYRMMQNAAAVISGFQAGFCEASNAACLLANSMSNLTKELRRFENAQRKIPL